MGGWPPDSVDVASEVFTALYAIELLHLCVTDPAHSVNSRVAANRAMGNGIVWLMQHQTSARLWSTGVVTEPWDSVIATAWVLHRLSATSEATIVGWRGCLEESLYALVQQALDLKTWRESTEAQRYRIEARIAASVFRAKEIPNISLRAQDASRLYLGGWSERLARWIEMTADADLDVATVTFALESIISQSQLKDAVEELLRSG